MARQKLIHLHGSTELTSVGTGDKKLQIGEIAVKNAAAGEAALFITNANGTAVVKFMDAAAVEAADATNAADIKKISDDYLKAADKTELQGEIDAAEGRITTLEGKFTGADSVAAQIEIAVKAEADRAKAAEEANTAAIAAIEADYLKEADKTELNNLITGLTATVNANETDIETKMSAEIARATKAEEDAETNAKAHANGLNTAMNTRVEDLEASTHTHANKALLDTYDQTNVDIKDAVIKKHEHANKAELDSIKSGDKAKWDAAAEDINAFLADSEILGSTVDTLKEIQEYINSDGEAAATMTQNIAKNAQDIAAEAARAKGVEAGLQTAVDAKVAKTDYNAKVAELVAADETNAQAIADEAARAKGAEAGLQAAIDAIAGEGENGSLAGTLQAAKDYTNEVLGGDYTSTNTVTNAFTTAIENAILEIDLNETGTGANTGLDVTVNIENGKTMTVTVDDSDLIIDCGEY